MVLEEYMFDEEYVKLLLKGIMMEAEKTGLGVAIDKTSLRLRCPFCATKGNDIDIGKVIITECKTCFNEFTAKRLGENYYLYIFEINQK